LLFPTFLVAFLPLLRPLLFFSLLGQLEPGVDVNDLIFRLFSSFAGKPTEPIPDIFERRDLNDACLASGYEMLLAILMLNVLNVISEP
jgi:hypothetical protein